MVNIVLIMVNMMVIIWLYNGLSISIQHQIYTSKYTNHLRSSQPASAGTSGCPRPNAVASNSCESLMLELTGDRKIKIEPSNMMGKLFESDQNCNKLGLNHWNNLNEPKNKNTISDSSAVSYIGPIGIAI